MERSTPEGGSQVGIRAEARKLADHPEVATRRENLARLQSQIDDVEALIQKRPTKAGNGTGPGLAELHNRRNLLRAALEIERQELRKVEWQASAAICLEARPRHVALVAEVIRTGLPHWRALDAERAFRKAHELDGVSVDTSIIHPMEIPSLGSLQERDSSVRRYLREAEEFGYPVPPIPEASRERAPVRSAR